MTIKKNNEKGALQKRKAPFYVYFSKQNNKQKLTIHRQYCLSNQLTFLIV